MSSKQPWQDVPALCELYSPENPPPPMLQEYARTRTRILENYTTQKQALWRRMKQAGARELEEQVEGAHSTELQAELHYELRLQYEPLAEEMKVQAERAAMEVEQDIDLFLMHNVREPQVCCCTPRYKYGYWWQRPKDADPTAQTNAQLIEAALRKAGELNGLRLFTMREDPVGRYHIWRDRTTDLDALFSINMQRGLAIFRATDGTQFSVHSSVLIQLE